MTLVLIQVCSLFRIGPILFCIKNVFWDILSVMGAFVITVFAFGVGLVSIFGVYGEEKVGHFSDFESAFKTLFWIIFDPGGRHNFIAIK